MCIRDRLNPFQRLRWRDLYEAFETGAKYALAVGAAAGTVGIVIGVVTLTGVGFKISYIVIAASQVLASGAAMVLPEAMADMQSLTLVAALIMTGVVCILMGCGVPTTANYLIMVAVAAPTLVQLGVQPIAAHFFVFYFGILADITPPWRWRPTRRRAWRAAIHSRPATPRSGWASPN